jgi:hypothetical protein
MRPVLDKKLERGKRPSAPTMQRRTDAGFRGEKWCPPKENLRQDDATQKNDG